MQLSISGLARLTGKSERTIARYLKDGPLAHCTRLDGGLYDVDETTLLQLRPQDVETTILQKLASIDERLARIEEALSRRREKSHDETIKQIAAPVRSVAPVQAPLLEVERQAQGEEIELKDLAAQLGISRSTLHEFVMQRNLAHRAEPIPHRQGQYKRWFSTEQVQAVKRARGM